MKLVIPFDELATFDFDIDISNYYELTKVFLENKFSDYDIFWEFDFRTLEYDETNKEISIQFR